MALSYSKLTKAAASNDDDDDFPLSSTTSLCHSHLFISSSILLFSLFLPFSYLFFFIFNYLLPSSFSAISISPFFFSLPVFFPFAVSPSLKLCFYPKLLSSLLRSSSSLCLFLLFLSLSHFSFTFIVASSFKLSFHPLITSFQLSLLKPNFVSLSSSHSLVMQFH